MSDPDPFRPVDPSIPSRPDGTVDRDRSSGTAGDSANDASPRATRAGRDRRTPERRSASGGPGGDDTVPAARSVSLETVYALIADSRRRRLLSILRSIEGPVSVRALAGDLADAAPGPAGDGTRDAIELTLVHNHLPRLASVGVVDYDRERRRVRPTDAFRSIEGHLETILETADETAETD